MASTHHQGQNLKVTVVSCSNLKNTEWISRQDPYVCLEYGNTKYRTKTHTDGGINPRFDDKFDISLIDGKSHLRLVVWNSNTLTRDVYIGSGEIHLKKVLSEGYDDTHCLLYTKNSSRSAGEVRVTMYYLKANQPATSYGPSAPPCPAPAPYPAYPRHPAAYPPQPIVYPPHYGPPPSAYPSQPTAYPSAYAPPPAGYPPIRQNSGSSYYAPDPYEHGGYYPRPY